MNRVIWRKLMEVEQPSKVSKNGIRGQLILIDIRRKVGEKKRD